MLYFDPPKRAKKVASSPAFRSTHSSSVIDLRRSRKGSASGPTGWRSDAAAAAQAHLLDDCLVAANHAEVVGLHDGSKLRQRTLLNGADGSDAGVVDEDVDGTEMAAKVLRTESSESTSIVRMVMRRFSLAAASASAGAYAGLRIAANTVCPARPNARAVS